MEIILSYVNDKFKMEMVDSKRRKRTSNFSKIEDTLYQLPYNPSIIRKTNKDLKIVYPNGYKLIMKDYKKYSRSKLYSEFFKGIDENTPIIKNVQKVNKKRIAALALTTITFVTVFLIKTGEETNTGNDFVVISEEAVEEPILPFNEQYETEQYKDQYKIEEKTVVIIDEINYDLLYRLEQSSKIMNSEINNNSSIPIGTKLNQYSINKITEFINSDDGKYCFEVCEDFGVDPYTFVSLLMNESSLNHKETIPGGDYYNGFAVGISQLETPNGQEIKAFNYSTNQEEVVYETMENAIDIKQNIKMGVMFYQNVLNRYNGNEKLALQSYNYGYGVIDLIITIYADEIGCSYEDVVNNFSDTGWLKYVKEVHEDPIAFGKKYEKYSQFSQTINYLINWQYGSYGNDKYLENLYSYYIGIYSKNIVSEKIIETNLLDNSVTTTAYENDVNYKIS